jgi:phasin family protein
MAVQNPFTSFADMDFSKFMQDLKLPGIDMESMINAQRKNMEAIAAAGKVQVEGMQSLAQRQVEMAQQSFDDFSGALKDLASVSSAQELTGKQAEMVKSAIENTLANIRELAESAAKSNSEAFQVINQRIQEGIAELKAMVKS